MNKIFKVIWNPATGSYSVASETAKSRGKKSGRSKLLISALIVTSAIFTPGAYAGLSLDGGDIFESTPLTNYWLAIGQGSVATTNNGGTDGVAMAIGLKAKALGAGSTAFGYDAEASGDRAIAFGQLTEASGNRTIAMGSGATATGDHSLALGGATKTLGMYSVAIGRDATTDSDYALSMGHMAKANGLYSLAMGAGSATSNDNAIAIGKKTQAQGVNSIALGNASQASGYSSLAIGELSETGAENAIALGKLSNASKINSIALGSNSTASGEGSVALGENSFAGGINSLALGSQSNANGDNAVALGVGSVAAQDNTVSVGNSTTQRKITNMAAGQIRNGSTEAINGSQLYGLSDSVAARLGGGAGVNEDGSINAPSYKLKSNIYNNVGDALLGIDNDTLHWDKTNKAFSASYLAKNADGSLKERSDQNKIINVAKGTISATSTDVVNGSQLYDLQQDALLWNGTAFSAAHGSDTTSKITNVAKGTVSATSTDVVNGSQLYDLQQDALLWNGTAFSAAHGTEATSKITNVEDGTISDTSKDAVNGSQLKETKDDVATNTANIADNTADIATNTTNIADNTADIATNTTDIATNTANIADNTTDIATNTANIATNTTDIATNTANIADNTADIATNTTDIATNTANIADNTANIATNTTDIATNTADIATNASSITTLNADVDTLEKDALLWNGTAFSAKHGTEATSKITNVTAGDLTAGSTDAVNGSQLKTTNDNVSTNTTNITNLTDSVGDLKDDSLLWNKAAGAFSAAHGTDTTSKITNVRAGSVSKNSTDAINGSQLYGVADSFTSYLGGGADISDTGVLTGSTYTIGDTDYTNVGDALAAINTSFSSSLGDALLWDATAGKFSAKHGINNDPSVITDVANGAVSSTSSDAINGSQLYGVSDYIADALGGNAVVNADGSITTPTYAIAGGSYDNVGDALEAIDTTLDDALLWDETANGGNGAFSAAHGKDKTASVITNVANGAVSATSSDAINGSQLYSTNKYIADALGGDAEVNADGTITAPTYTIANTDYNNVGEALDALDNNALLWDATANNGAGAYSASHDGKASIITNVADGNIGEDSTDAINGSQLNATNMMIQQNSEIINQLAGDTSKNYIGDNGAGINYVRTNDSGLAFNDASAAGIGSTAVGYNTVAKGDSSVAIGHGSNSIVETSIALGSESVSSRLIVKGSRNTRVTENGVEIGYDTTDGELLGALSIGDDGKYRQIINVADGSEAHDAVTVRQLQNAIGAVATTPTKYYHANSTAEDSLAVGEDSLAMGAKTIVNGNAGIGIGLNTLVLADAINGIAIGSNARANHADSIAMGNGSQTTRGAQTNYTAYNMDAPQNSVGEFSVGSEDGQRQITNVAAGSADTDAVNVGQLKVTDAQVSQNTQSITNLNTQVTNLDTRVTNIENGIGDIVTTGSTKYFKTNTDGADANAQGKDSVAIGSGSIAAADNSVALGTGSVADEENTISVGSSTNQRRITNVAAGVNATDAVNVSQLKSSEAGGVRYDTKADGSIDYSNITLGGGNGGTTRISNVSAGVNNNDAVNYAQLKQSVQETKQYTDQRMVEMDNKLSKTESKLSGGIASAMAMTGLPQAYTPGASMASIGGGTYNGESAVALGVSMVSANGRWVYKLQGSTNSQGEYSAALGAGIQW
ncbi:TPA: YadA-like family protein [Escherichia coli]|uniref:YadA-like family protein n=2 Tax=Escherichia coli TaxID=562 RepID=UPI001BCCB2E1|nr:YadA-like family protein [Escherichia coli]EHW4644009.1 YadA-like family protein [Escherichia coli]EHX8712440.1 YadA-like family protein [Escherichia coli]EIL2518155.1 YadA-like family protein [Escherichia coli]EIR7933270.1 YadA-like family protein [Escherichia coli]EJA2246650.1 YadA-like family protein [Escherichia coli]